MLKLIELIEVTIKLNGIIFKKAELEKDFVGVYSRVLERIFELEDFGDDFILVLGNAGG